jgi:hypothetical protein
MTDNSILWQALQAYIPRKTWIPLSDILATVRSRVTLDKEDLERKDLPPGPPAMGIQPAPSAPSEDALRERSRKEEKRRKKLSQT